MAVFNISKELVMKLLQKALLLDRPIEQITGADWDLMIKIKTDIPGFEKDEEVVIEYRLGDDGMVEISRVIPSGG